MEEKPATKDLNKSFYGEKKTKRCLIPPTKFPKKNNSQLINKPIAGRQCDRQISLLNLVKEEENFARLGAFSNENNLLS